MTTMNIKENLSLFGQDKRNKDEVRNVCHLLSNCTYTLESRIQKKRF